MQTLDTLAERLAEAAEQHAAVARLEGGGLVETATYLPGRRVMGVRESDSSVEVHVVLHWPPAHGRSIPAIVDDLRASLGRLTSKPLTIVVRDLEDAPQDSVHNATGGLS
jgi:hypothetical protein